MEKIYGHTLLIHIGAPKTGTTALQTFLYKNEKKLEEYGWCYPDLRKEFPELQEEYRENNGNIFYDKNMKINVSTEKWNKIWMYILKYLESQNVILSAEQFSYWDTEAFLCGAKEKYNNIKVVIYLRRQDRQLESLWNQSIKCAICSDVKIQNYIKMDNNKFLTEFIHYNKKLDKIKKIIGKNNLIVRVYEKQQFSGTECSIESDFLSILDIKPIWSEWDDCGLGNPRLSGNYIEIKRIFNTILASESMCSRKELSDIFIKLAHSFNENKAGKGYLTNEERRKLMMQFEAENEQIAREYLHREDGRLFYDDKMDYPQDDIHHCNSFERDLIYIFATMICRQNRIAYCQSQEIQKLRRSVVLFAEKLLLQKAGKRKFLLFGAGQKCKELLRYITFPVDVIADNDEKKNGKTMDGLDIIEAKRIEDWTKYFIVVTCIKTDEIEKQLQQMGLIKEEDFVLAKEYFAYN